MNASAAEGVAPRRPLSSMSTRERNTAWLQIVLVALAPIAAAALAASFVWSVHAMAAGAPLELVGLTSRACPGCAACGLSRAFAAMSHGDVAAAIHLNPAVLALYPAFWAVAIAGFVIAGRYALARRHRCRPLRW